MKFLLLSLSVALASLNPTRGRNELMPPDAAARKWGNITFEETRFKNGDVTVKAQMAADLVAKNPYRGKSYDEVKRRLGKFTGYYWSHRIPAYLIQEGWNSDRDTWQIVFELDSQNRVTEVKIHKNCCYTSSENGARSPTKN